MFAAALAAGLIPGTVGAQAPRLPEDGGLTRSIGQPLQWHWQAGLSAGAFMEGQPKAVMVRSHFGFSRGVRSSLTGLLELGAEGYLGARGARADGGMRGILRLAYFGMGIGVDYNIAFGRTDMLVTASTPVRRGGLLTRGTMLRLDWYPMQNHTFTLGVTTPLGDRLAGRTRPLLDYVVVTQRFSEPAPHRSGDPELAAVLDTLRVSAEWIRRETVPYLDHDGPSAAAGVARTARYLDAIRPRLAARSAVDEVRFFHAQLTRAFAIAAGSDALGVILAQGCREILLHDVLLPYDALLGRKKKGDTVRELGIAARGRFGRWLATDARVPAARREAVLFAFQSMANMLDEMRDRAAREWDDPRLVWLPLQLALLPEDVDEQSELDALIEEGTAVRFTDRNRLSYVANLQFHHELIGMIHDTRAYHVLWIHDFPAAAGDSLDAASFDQVVDGYLAAMAARVRAYDSTGTLASYFIFLDQHYYDLRRSRILMDVLENPLHASSQLPLASAIQQRRLAEALSGLRAAVDSSRVLQAERREYGDDWLRNRIKVHVNITNRVDASFWSGGLISSLFGYPDDVMRDHRKIAFRDVTDAEPNRGVAILTGMGVGQAYMGPRWDDRSLVVQGPVALELKDAARDLLLSQGLAETELPQPFRTGVYRATRFPAGDPEGERHDARAAAFVNGTGYLPKSLNVARTLLYSLLPAGAVLRIPDSLWNSTFYGALLVGAALRGGRVLIISPARDNAPSDGFPQLERAHELMTRLLLAQRSLENAMASAGGELRIGLYALPPDENGFASRAALWSRQLSDSSFLRPLLPFSPDVMPIVTAFARDPASMRLSPETLPPRLHQKVQFFATRQYWDAVTASPAWPRLVSAYLQYRLSTYATGASLASVHERADTLEAIARQVVAATHGVPHAAGFAMIGSQNQDYRGMFMDGEVGVLFTGAASLAALMDLVFLEGIVTWIGDQETLDRLLPPAGELRRRISRIAKDGL